MQEFQRQKVELSKLPRPILDKWSDSRNKGGVLDEGFVPFPKKLVRCLHQIFPDADSMKQLSALLAVVDFKRPNLTRHPSLGYLAFLAGLEVEEFDAALCQLQEKGYVKVSGTSEALDVSLGGLLEAIEKETK